MTESKIELYLNEHIFSGWTRLSVFRSLESMSGQFDLGIAIRPEDDVSQIKPGSKIQLKMNGQTVITGYLDSLSQSISGESKEISVSGRDKTADLVDCSVIHQSYHFKNQTLQQIAEVICKPFGIKVVWQATEPGANEKMNVWQVEPGETAFDTLSKAARHKGVLVTSNVDGDLVFTDPSDTVVGEFKLGENILELELNDDWTQRFSLYRVIGDAEQGGAKGNESAVQEADIFNEQPQKDH
ncbi:phage tail protein [Canicola haemoglobinophilus]|uniref:Bacteriophage Mu P family protein n=1 Tax=Canicola haemoglobinophilus TaxID=733 RepID=A0A1V4B443_9PAST|nr:contractile injection system protein, VgrG/Pvc8 family [Canicola haemoglobinophilus]OOS02201.1 phage tail protein [Canicola haemoglobinophilus]STO55368.1 bacteriophage Mu P family protein [Canicola haemoglobinophilus]STO59670.1 bacteriophage Mu P family protein [Canicola haemoglobinophilus]STO69063.1 bacteriophage Mu P family protein [Canicola haemoglobinophilus]